MAGKSGFLLYGSNGFVGDAIARRAVQSGLRPILAGRNAERISAQAAELGLEHRIFDLNDPAAADKALADVVAVLNCAGPFLYTSAPMVESCLRTQTHYMDLTGEIPVYEGIAARDADAKTEGVMLLPGVGFDVVPTDCLAAQLKQRLPSATRLTIAFWFKGPAALPPGTTNTMVELIPYGNSVRRNGKLVTARAGTTRTVDFGEGPVKATLVTWGDVFIAYHSTGIPNIEDYILLPDQARQMMVMIDLVRPLFRLSSVRESVKKRMQQRSTPEQRAQSSTLIWAEVQDDQGRKAAARLSGPEGGVVWTSLNAVAAVKKVLAGTAKPGFQTPSLAFGPEFVMEIEGVTREELG